MKWGVAEGWRRGDVFLEIGAGGEEWDEELLRVDQDRDNDWIVKIDER